MFIKVLLINENGASFVDVENDYHAFNDLLGWDDSWNTPTIKVWGDDYICVCCDTGKIQHLPVSAITLNDLLSPTGELHEPFIVGNIIVTKFDGKDDFKSLTEHEIDKLRTRLYKIPNIISDLKDFNRTLLILD